ncbi:hypothetical protein QVD17_30733 [Tagetes erecta]|uniref:Reverse transcriptase Ty1/copia-type domain-containing protein n=1 Tax=Tagetes erecta TaxID=13708 RepID=A0AAD8K2E1_TARER|nr:hypothetical protein QVD17_30733 [Tagetes erecta]
MPELKDEGKKPEDQTKALVVSVQDGYDWSAYAEQFTSDLTSNLALVCEIEEDWSEEGDIEQNEAVSEDSEEYDWSVKADPAEETETEVAVMATANESSSSTEQPKVISELPPNYVPLPEDVKGKTRKEAGDLGSFSDDSDNDDDGNLNSEYPFLSFHNPDHVKSSQAPGPSGSQEAQESNVFNDVNPQVSPNDGESVPSQQTGEEIDPTLFMKRENDDLLCVQVYVDDIIFGSTSASMCKEFEEIMKSRFQMSSMGEINFFLGLQVTQSADGIFINQSKFVEKLLKKFKMQDCQTIRTPSDMNCKIQPDPKGKAVDQTLYRSMIGSLMYLTASRPDIMYSVCVCARYQSDPKESHLVAVKRIFRYLKGKPSLGLWKSTTGGCQFLGPRLVSWQCKKQTNVSVSTAEAEYIAASAGCSQIDEDDENDGQGDEQIEDDRDDGQEHDNDDGGNEGAESESNSEEAEIVEVTEPIVIEEPVEVASVFEEVVAEIPKDVTVQYVRRKRSKPVIESVTVEEQNVIDTEEIDVIQIAQEVMAEAETIAQIVEEADAGITDPIPVEIPTTSSPIAQNIEQGLESSPNFVSSVEDNEKENRIAELEEMVQKLIEANDSLKASNERKKKRFEEFWDIHNQNLKTFKELDSDHLKLKIEHDELKAEHAKLKEEYENLKYDYTEVKAECNTLEDEKEMLEKLLKEMKPKKAGSGSSSDKDFSEEVIETTESHVPKVYLTRARGTTNVGIRVESPIIIPDEAVAETVISDKAEGKRKLDAVPEILGDEGCSKKAKID